MIDLYLKFTDEAQSIEVLAGYKGNVDVIGVIYKRTGGTDEEPVMTALPGWHVNVRGIEHNALTAFATTPATPHRVWA